MGGGTTKSVGDHKIMGTFYGGIAKFWVPFMRGDPKINFRDVIKIGVFFLRYLNGDVLMNLKFIEGL